MMGQFFTFFANKSDAFTAIGVILTFIIGLCTLIVTIKNNKSTYYIDTITKNRISWIYNLRKLISEYVSAASLYSNTSMNALNDDAHYKRILQIGSEIKLMLNFLGKYDLEIIKAIDTTNTTYENLIDMYEISINYSEELFNHTLNPSILSDPIFIDYLIGCAKQKSIEVLSIDEYMDDIDNVADLYLSINTTIEENEKFLKDLSNQPAKLVRQVNENLDNVIKLAQVYLKSEWNRIKIEANGKKYTTKQQDDAIEELINLRNI